MNLMFWKKKADTGGGAETPQENPAGEAVAHEAPDSISSGTEAPDPEPTEALAKPGLVARVKLLLAALIRRFKKPPVFQAEGDQAPGAPKSPESEPEDDAPAGPVNLKKRLIIGGAIGLLILLLVGAGFAVWKAFLPAKQEDADTTAAVETLHAVQSAPSAVVPIAEIEALKKKNDELQAQIDALKKEQSQSDAATAPQASQNIVPSPENGSLTVDNKNPQATAMSLKEAIESMNAASGDYDKKKTK